MRGLLANGNGFGEVVFAAGTGADAEGRITKRAREVAAQLAERVRKETRLLPFPTCVTLHFQPFLTFLLSLSLLGTRRLLDPSRAESCALCCLSLGRSASGTMHSTHQYIPARKERDSDCLSFSDIPMSCLVKGVECLCAQARLSLHLALLDMFVSCLA